MSDFFICYTDSYDSYQSPERYGDWWKTHNIEPHVIMCGNENINIRSAMYGNNHESITFLDRTEPDFDEPFYIVYGIYSDGDSFGHSTGNVEWIGFTQDVYFCTTLIGELRSKFSDFTVEFVYNDFDYKIPVPWAGYFEHLSSMEWKEIKVHQ